MIVGCYRLDLYCDTGGDRYGRRCPHRSVTGNLGMGVVTGLSERACMKMARQAGWTFAYSKGNRQAYCPVCSKARKAAKPEVKP